MATETDSHGVEPIDLEAAGMCVDSHGSAIGMPQLCGEWMGNQVFWLLVTLVVIYLILARVALPRIAAVLAERSGAITNDLAQAEELKHKAVAAEAAYEKALAEARAEAQRIGAEAKADIQAELAEATKAADAEIAEKTAGSEARIAEIRDSAAQNVEIVARDTARAIVEALGVSASEAAVDAAVKARLGGGAT